jgi:hypothetical protein
MSSFFVKKAALSIVRFILDQKSYLAAILGANPMKKFNFVL